MTQPVPYVPTADYSVDIVPGDLGNALDHDFDDLQITTDQIRANLALIQRDDGLLANGAVGIDQLAAETLDLLGNWNPRGAWVTATAYAKLDFVVQGGVGYLCPVAHTSGVFATDLAAGKWVPLSKVDSLASPFTLTLVDDVSAAAWLTTLGISAFIQTLLDDANVSAAQTTLGISTFIKTLIDDADAATARGTLGTYSTAQVDAADAATLVSANGSAILKTIVDAKGDLLGASADNTPARLPVGTNNQVLAADSSQATGLIWQDKIAAPAVVPTTSGSSANVVSVPSRIKRITIYFNGVSTNGTANPGIQIGDSGGLETAGYVGSMGLFANAGSTSSAALGGTNFTILSALAAAVIHGKAELALIDAATNTWSCTITASDAAGRLFQTCGTKSLTAALDRFSLVTTDTFDAGSFTYFLE